MNQQRIGSFITKLRKEKKYTQKNIADLLGISEKTVSKWECGNGLPEVVYMEPLCRILGITVNELLAGEHISIGQLMETLDQTRIELIHQLEFEQLKLRIYKEYNLEIDSMEASENGAGSLTYIVSASGKKYVVKYPFENEMNRTEAEPGICRELLDKNIPVCVFMTNKQKSYISTDENGRKYSVQHYFDGTIYDYNEASKKLQPESARMLAKIHMALKECEPLPAGIGEEFLKYRRPENMISSYENTLKQAIENGDADVVNSIRSNMEILSSFPEYSFDLSKMSIGNTHGDYKITQQIWKENRLTAVIDWTTACQHPYIWEIFRSYVFMAPECKNKCIDINALIKYFQAYLEVGKLTSYDIEIAGKFYYYFLAVCNFYGQYYDSLTKNRELYLKQAEMATGLMQWFAKNIDELSCRLKELTI